MAVLLDLSADDALKAFMNLKEDLQLKSEDFRVVHCGKRGAKNDIFEAPVISLQDLGWSGRISEEASAFLNTEYDVFISFTASENKMADFLVSVSRARLKVGRKRSDKNGIFDLNISAELSQPEIFTAELKKYLKILNTTTE